MATEKDLINGKFLAKYLQTSLNQKIDFDRPII